ATVGRRLQVASAVVGGLGRRRPPGVVGLPLVGLHRRLGRRLVGLLHRLGHRLRGLHDGFNDLGHDRFRPIVGFRLGLLRRLGLGSSIRRLGLGLGLGLGSYCLRFGFFGLGGLGRPRHIVGDRLDDAGGVFDHVVRTAEQIPY